MIQTKIIAKNNKMRPFGINHQKILIMEDNENMIEIISKAFEMRGIKIIKTKSGKEGIALAKKERPDAIVLDILLNDIDGFDVLAILKEESDTQSIPVIIYTNLQNTNDKLESFKLGAEAYYYKTEVPPLKLVNNIIELIQNQ